MDGNKQDIYFAPFLKEEHSEEEMPREEEKDEGMEMRDPWSDLLFGRPMSSESSEKKEDHDEHDEE